MSANRIRYIDHKFKENCKISLRAYTSERTGAKYRIILNLEEMIYCIRNERSKEFVYKSNTYTNLNVLKRSARAKLEKYGISLKKEVRDRTFGRVEAGMTQDKWEKQQELEKGE